MAAFVCCSSEGPWISSGTSVIVMGSADGAELTISLLSTSGSSTSPSGSMPDSSVVRGLGTNAGASARRFENDKEPSRCLGMSATFL